jgi:hypothetical protein
MNVRGKSSTYTSVATRPRRAALARARALLTAEKRDGASPLLSDDEEAVWEEQADAWTCANVGGERTPASDARRAAADTPGVMFDETIVGRSVAAPDGF